MSRDSNDIIGEKRKPAVNKLFSWKRDLWSILHLVLKTQKKVPSIRTAEKVCLVSNEEQRVYKAF